MSNRSNEKDSRATYVRGENSFRIAAESTFEQVHQWVEDWFEFLALEVWGGQRQYERFILCSNRIAAVAELQGLAPGPLLTFIRELGEAKLSDRVPTRADSHLGEAQDVVERVDSWALGQVILKDSVHPQLDNEGPREANRTPPKYLASWREILVALGNHDSREDQRKVSRLNKSYSGPIVIPGQGKQPFVDKAKLLHWWAGLEAKVEESQQRKRDAQATVAKRHDFGRDGEVAPLSP